jgi:3-methyl-2-oxobutanoate hydroxymethyltransferase
MLDIGTAKRPRFSKSFMQNADSIQTAIVAYHQAVKQGQFPTSEHSF